MTKIPWLWQLLFVVASGLRNVSSCVESRASNPRENTCHTSLDPSTYASWYAYVDQSANTNDKGEVANRPSRSPY